MKKTMYVISKGNVLRKIGRRLRLENKGNRIWEVPCKEIGRVLVYGTVEVTSQTMNGLFDENIPIYYARKSGSAKGRIVPMLDHRVHWRMLQYQKFMNPQLSLPLAKNSVANKIANMQQMIIYIHRNGKGTAQLCEPLQRYQQKLHNCTRSEEIMGVEGIASKHYFEIYGQAFPENFTFTKRSRQPAIDFTNALLNLGYMTLFREIAFQLEAHGLDPYLGYFHAPQDGRASLALDILEEFRQPFIDLFILKIIRSQQIKEEYFTQDEKGIKLNDNGFHIFFRLYEDLLGTNDGEEPGKRKMIEQQIVIMKKYLSGKSGYMPFQVEYS